MKAQPLVDPPVIHPALLPLDEYNQALQSNVHPQEWVNPEAQPLYNLVVIGAGSAGLITAFGAAGLGAKVALIEQSLMGGDCLNVGCVPSKCLLSSADLMGEIKRARELGLKGGETVQADFSQVMRRLREVRSHISHHDSVWRAKELGVDLFLGTGRFVSPQTIEVAGKKLNFKKAVIATGGRALVPEIPGLKEAPFYTNETIFSLTTLPKRLAVIGGGPIGCELAQAFARLGSQVTLLEGQPQFLIREDVDVATLLAQGLRSDGVDIRLSAQVTAAQATGGVCRLKFNHQGAEATLEIEAVLVAVGRMPNLEGLNLETARVKYDARKGVEVNDYLRTSNRRIYACGDIALPFKFTHMADASARLVLANTLFYGRRRLSRLTIPWCTYTDPEIAHVGLYEKEAVAQGIAVETLLTPFSTVDRALTEGDSRGFVKIHLRRGTDQILGATIVGAHAGELISEITLAMVEKIGLSKIANVIHPYPTRAEVIRKTADAYNRKRLTPRIKKLFQGWFTWQRR